MEAMANSDPIPYPTTGIEIFYNICLVSSFCLCFTQSENIGSKEGLQ